MNSEESPKRSKLSNVVSDSKDKDEPPSKPKVNKVQASLEKVLPKKTGNINDQQFQEIHNLIGKMIAILICSYIQCNGI